MSRIPQKDQPFRDKLKRLGEPCRKCGQIHKRCTAHTKHGKPCTRFRILGGLVCYTHGWARPLIKKAAEKRVAEAVTMLIGKDEILKELRAIALADIRQLYRPERASPTC